MLPRLAVFTLVSSPHVLQVPAPVLPCSLESLLQCHAASSPSPCHASLPLLFTFTRCSCPLKSVLPSGLLFRAGKSAKPETTQQQSAALPSQREALTCVFTLLHKRVSLQKRLRRNLSFLSSSACCCVTLRRDRLQPSPWDFSQVPDFYWRPCPLMAGLPVTGSHSLLSVELHCWWLIQNSLI